MSLMSKIHTEALERISHSDLPSPLLGWLRNGITILPTRTPTVAQRITGKRDTGLKTSIEQSLQDTPGHVLRLKNKALLHTFAVTTAQTQRQLKATTIPVPCGCKQLHGTHPHLFEERQTHTLIRTHQQWSSILPAPLLPAVCQNARNAKLPCPDDIVSSVEKLSQALLPFSNGCSPLFDKTFLMYHVQEYVNSKVTEFPWMSNMQNTEFGGPNPQNHASTGSRLGQRA